MSVTQASMDAAHADVRPLPPIAARVDAALAEMDDRIDWLTACSPIHNQAMWQAFEDSGRAEVPPLVYPELEIDLHASREKLLALPMEDIESPLLQGLLSEKQRELDREIELIRLRDSDGFVNASIELFGNVEPRLMTLANDILAKVATGPSLAHDAGVDEVVAAAEADLAWYRQRHPKLTAQVIVDPDLDSLLVVSQGNLYVAADIRVPGARVQPLVQHEIGTHVVTRHNGSRQALKQLQVGLAHYDPLQEGLGVLAEYLCGFLPADRLRVLAARVVGVEMATRKCGIAEIFHRLHGGHGLPTQDAFDVAVRACRGGGLTKDAVYLAGLRDLLDYLAGGGEFEALFIGKFALSQRGALEQVIEQGWARAPELLPRYLTDPAADARLARCRAIPVEQLFHDQPATDAPDPGGAGEHRPGQRQSDDEEPAA